MAAALDPATQSIVNRETDARFWANTGYKPGQKLDPANAFDRMWVPTWKSIAAQVAKEMAAGTIRWTYNTPEVADLITKGLAASKEAAAQIAAANAAKASGDHAKAAQHIADAHGQIGAAQIATAQAAAYMPPPPPEIHPQAAAAASAAHQVMTFSMNGAGQGVQTGGAAPPPASPISGDDQVALVQTALAPTRIPQGAAASLADPMDSPTLPGGRGHNALWIAGLCAALAGGVAIANATQKPRRVSFRARR